MHVTTPSLRSSVFIGLITCILVMLYLTFSNLTSKTSIAQNRERESSPNRYFGKISCLLLYVGPIYIYCIIHGKRVSFATQQTKRTQ